MERRTQKVQERAHAASTRALELADEMLEPRSQTSLDEIEELRTASVPQHTIEKLYSLTPENYVPGIARLFSLEAMEQYRPQVQSLANQIPFGVVSAEHWQDLDETEAPSQDRALLELVACALLLSKKPMDALLDASDDWQRKHDSEDLLEVTQAFAELCEIMRKRYLVSAEPDAIKRLKLRLQLFPQHFERTASNLPRLWATRS